MYEWFFISYYTFHTAESSLKSSELVCHTLQPGLQWTIFTYCRDANLWRSQILRYFFGPARPPPPCDSPQENYFSIWTPYPPPPPNYAGNAGKTWIYLSGTSISWIFIQSDSCLYRCNKEKTLFFLFATTTVQSCITLENDARNHNESIRSQMILEFWNLWSLNPSFLWATDPNFILCRSFGYPYRRAEDWLCIRESWHICYCIFKKRKTLQKLYLS